VKSTSRFTKNKRGIECLNCKQPISNNDNFCSNCGQVNDTLPLSIKQFISEFFAGFFSFDSRFFKTFIPLLFKPGKVSQDYIEGKRRRYVNPFQLYLHVTILFFLITGIFSAIDEYKITNYTTKDTEEVTKNSAIKGITDALEENNIKKDSIINAVNQKLAKDSIDVDLYQIKNLDSIIKDNVYKDKFDYFLNNKNKTISQLSRKTKRYIDSTLQSSLLKDLDNKLLSTKEKDSIFDKFYNQVIQNSAKLVDASNIKEIKQLSTLSKIKEFNTLYIEDIIKSKNIDYSISEKHKISLEDDFIKNIVGQNVFKKISDFMAYDKEHKKVSIINALDSLNYKKTRWNIFYYKKAQDFNKFKEDSNFRKSYLDSVISKISVALFFMLPIFTLFLSLLYIRHKKNYTEHLVFVFNVQTVFFIILIFFTVFDRIFVTDIGIGLSILIFLFYLYKSLRNFYKQGKIKTIIKYFMLNTAFVFLAFIGLIIISFLAFIFQ